MTYKAGDLVYFDDGVQKGVGKVVIIIGDHILVNSTQIKNGHSGGIIFSKQDNENNWDFFEEHLKPFVKKVGQKYKVISNENNGLEIGDIVTIDCVYHQISDYVTENFGVITLYDLNHDKCELEFYAEAQSAKENEMFTKYYLKVGYLVKVRNGKFAHVVDTENHGLCLNHENGWDTLSVYNNDLTSQSSDRLDIIEVYGYTLYGYNAHMFTVSGRKLLWKREEVKEMTIEDIQKVLGHKIKVVE